ncbi:MAG TPA: cytochrome C oxidase subunit II [Candidatus Eisenbacteria bacterium]|nr:cytochrome C oxidase subunit II [Candidatus Eisenbacteria bacterium]
MNLATLAAASWATGALVLAGFFALFARLAIRPAAPFPELSRRAYRIRPFWLVTLTGTLLALLVASLPDLPYESSRLAQYDVAGASLPAISVHATQYSWALSPAAVRGATPVEFLVTSDDVTHGFGIYDANDRIAGQVQAMPGFTNRLVMELAPGDYAIRCLEYCGPGHAHMTSHLHVQCGPNGC